MKATLLSTILRGKTVALTTIALAAMVTSSYAAGPNLVTDGGFETTTGNGSGTFQHPYFSNEISNGSYSGTSVAGWTNSSGAYNMLYVQGDNSANDESGANDLALKSFPGASANGGNFVALDADFNTGSISQTINGLTATDTYTLSFDIATGQQTGFNPSNFNESLTASLGGSSHSFSLTNPADNDWSVVSWNFTATSSSEVLQFLAGGVSVNGNLPAFVLLDGISLTDITTHTPPASTPEPSSLILLGTGLAGVAGAIRRKLGR
jgi:hypothetical protein